MIPFIRSHLELMAITNPIDKVRNKSRDKDLYNLKKDSGQRTKYNKSINKDKIELPHLQKRKRRKWVKSKEAFSRLLEDLDYNNQIKPSYDIMLLEKYNKTNQTDAA